MESYIKIKKSVLYTVAVFITAAVFYTLFFLNKPHQPPLQLSFHKPLPQVKVGDWVFREGSSLDSKVILSLSGGQYSHIGMITRTHPEIIVVHATTDDDPQKSNQVIQTPLMDFLQPELAKHFAIVRPLFMKDQEIQLLTQDLVQEVGKPFILSDQQTQRRYCTTIILDAILKYIPDFKPQWQYVNAPLFKGHYLFPQAFWQYSDTQLIYQQ